MNSNPRDLCRLCLQISDDAVNIWEAFQDSTIASVLAKHFWFQVDDNDGMSEWICQACWIQTETFHEFYKRIESRHCRSNDLIGLDSIKEERSVSPTKEALEPDLNLYEYETREPLVAITPHFLLCKEENSSDYKNCNDDQNENLLASEHMEQRLLDTIPKDDNLPTNVVEKRTLPSDAETKNLNSCSPYSHSEHEELDAQIFQLFNTKCEICTNVEFKTLLEVRRHYRRVHKVKGYLTCCGKKFWRRHLMVNHVRYHTNPDAYRCDYCGKGFYHKKALINHITCHLPRAHKCSLCSSSFTRENLLKVHVNLTHSSKTGEKFPCDKCDKDFRSKLLLSCHIRCVHEFSLEHVCDTCARRFKTKQILQNHIIREHSTQSKVQCDTCGAWLKHETGLRRHLITQHQQTNLQVLNCPICNKVMKNRKALKGHISYVHGERRFKCGLCDKSFKAAKNLKEHIACHTGEDLYDCPYCKKKFKSSANLCSHRKKAHSVELSSLKNNFTNKDIETEFKSYVQQELHE